MKNSILHLSKHPFYGPGENSFNTINRVLEGSHVFVDAFPYGNGDTDETIGAAVQIRQRADVYLRTLGMDHRIDFSDSAKLVIGYDFSFEEILSTINPGNAILVSWDLGGVDDQRCDFSHGRIAMTCRPSKERPDRPLVYPLLDVDNLCYYSGVSTKPSIMVAFDPMEPGFNPEAVKAVSEALSDKYRVLTTYPSGLYEGTDPAKFLLDYAKHSEKGSVGRVVLKEFCIGFDARYQSLCDIHVSDHSLCPGRYGFLCSTALSMGKLLICDKAGEYASYTKDRISAIHFDDSSEIGRYVKWALDPDHSLLVKRLSSAGQYASYVQDKEPNLHRFLSLLSEVSFVSMT